jgi:hypothetical protein
MADIVYRANLKTSAIPLLSELQGQSIIVRGQDQNYVSGLAAKESIDTSFGIPQVYYCHNVIPNDNGYQSVGYNKYTTSQFPVTYGFSETVTIRDGSGNSASLATTSVGNLYILAAGSTVWAEVDGAPAAASIAGKRMTVAYVSGITYIYFANYGCYFYNFGTSALVPVTLTGLTAADILGISGNSGYLLAYDEENLAWSSTTDPTDFVPSLVTGAGSGAVEGARGAIVTVEQVYGGLLICTTGNAVAAVYSGNVRYPYNFVEVTGSGGLSNPSYIAQDTGTGAVYAYTTSGMQLITLRTAQTVFAEVTDFLSGSKFENFNETTFEFEIIDATGFTVPKKIALIADRYLIVSYGVENTDTLNRSIYLDLTLKQMGILKHDHVDCFEFQLYGQDLVEVPRKSVAFLGENGDVHILDTDLLSTSSHGVIILGKYQYVRTRHMTMQSALVENVETGADFTLYDFASIAGKSLGSRQAGYLAETDGLARRYNFHQTGKNHSLLGVGAFNLVSLELTFTVHGAR